MSKCYRCQKEATGPKDISFKHKGLEFNYRKFGIICDDCEEAKTIEKFERYAAKYISFDENKKPVVDWKNVALDDSNESAIFGVLSDLCLISTREGWAIINESLIIGPSIGFMACYFLEKEEALQFAKARFGGALYSVYVVLMTDFTLIKEGY